MKTPLLSVVIPTYKRPQLLSRAIDSVLDAHQGTSLEIIVVPNGADSSWKVVADKFRANNCIKWFHTEKAHACSARNHGLSRAQGKYLRFLDDDDCLLSNASNQLALIQENGCDMSFAPLVILTPEQKQLKAQLVPPTGDYISAAVSSREISLLHGSLYLKSTLKCSKWREDIVLGDDYIWTLEIAKYNELSWVKFQDPVVGYTQHYGPRLTHEYRSAANSRKFLQAIIDFYESLKSQGRLSAERELGLANALASYAHSLFPSSPVSLTRTIQKARDISSDAAPSHAMFQKFPLLSKNLIAAEWCMLPPRILTRTSRRISWTFIRSLRKLTKRKQEN